MLTFELFEHGSKSKLKSEILLYYKVKKTLHVLNLPNGWNSVYHNLCNGMESSKHSMVKSPYFFSTFIVMPGALYPKLTLTSYPNKLLDEDYMLNKFGTSTCCTKNQTMDYHKLPRTNIERKNLSNTLKDIFPS